MRLSLILLAGFASIQNLKASEVTPGDCAQVFVPSAPNFELEYVVGPDIPGPHLGARVLKLWTTPDAKTPIVMQSGKGLLYHLSEMNSDNRLRLLKFLVEHEVVVDYKRNPLSSFERDALILELKGAMTNIGSDPAAFPNDPLTVRINLTKLFGVYEQFIRTDAKGVPVGADASPIKFLDIRLQPTVHTFSTPKQVLYELTYELEAKRVNLTIVSSRAKLIEEHEPEKWAAGIEDEDAMKASKKVSKPKPEQPKRFKSKPTILSRHTRGDYSLDERVYGLKEPFTAQWLMATIKSLIKDDKKTPEKDVSVLNEGSIRVKIDDPNNPMAAVIEVKSPEDRIMRLQRAIFYYTHNPLMLYGERGDVFAIGVMLYRRLTQDYPFESDLWKKLDPETRLQNLPQLEYRALKTYDPNVHPMLENIIESCFRDPTYTLERLHSQLLEYGSNR